METYLKGYLSILPSYDKGKVEKTLVSYDEKFSKDMTKEEFEFLLEKLAEKNSVLTEYIPQFKKLSPKKHNEFYKNIYLDLCYLFDEAIMIEKVTANYKRMLDGILFDMQKEVDQLRKRVIDLRLVTEEESETIVHSNTFSTSLESQQKNGNEHLFIDRNGELANQAIIERAHDRYYLSIDKTLESDALRNERGYVTAKIEVVERRGQQTNINEIKNKYKIDNAIDGSLDTAWVDVVLTDEPIKIGINK